MTTEQIAQSKMREINIHSSFVLKPSSQSSLEREKEAEERHAEQETKSCARTFPTNGKSERRN